MFYSIDGHKFKIKEEAREYFSKDFDKAISTDIVWLAEWLFDFTSITEVLEILYKKDKTIIKTLLDAFSEELKQCKQQYVDEEVDYLDEEE